MVVLVVFFVVVLGLPARVFLVVLGVAFLAAGFGADFLVVDAAGFLAGAGFFAVVALAVVLVLDTGAAFCLSWSEIGDAMR